MKDGVLCEQESGVADAHPQPSLKTPAHDSIVHGPPGSRHVY